MLLPRNLTVREGEDATFTCELPCSHEAFWYIGDYANSFPLPFTDSEPDLTYSRGFPDGSCEITDPGSYIDSLTILATPELNNVAVQCSASMINCESGDDSCGDIMYSRFRILRGMYVYICRMCGMCFSHAWVILACHVTSHNLHLTSRWIF